MKARKTTVQICPVCRSKDITLWAGAVAGIIYICKKCNYRGPVIIEEDR